MNILSKLKQFIFKNKTQMDKDSIMKWLEEGQFGRYYMYTQLMNFIDKEFHDKKYTAPKIIELGGSNTLIQHMFNSEGYSVAPNYPEVDVTDLKNYADNTYDFVIMDQVLEHVSNPYKAVSEAHRILKKGGWFINTTPFLIEIHEVPVDFWRFTGDALRELTQQFADVEVNSWGNKATVLWQINEERWPSVTEAREGDHFKLHNEEKFPLVYWLYAKK